MRPWRRVFTAAVKMPSWFIAAFAAESSPAVVYETMRRVRSTVVVGILFSVKGKIVFSSVTARENSNNTSRKFIRDINAELEYCGMIFFPLFLVVVAVLKGDLKFLAVQKPYELLQFLVSKSVACCVPFETYGKHSGAQSAEVVSLLHHLIVDSDPSLYDFIREFEHFPELVIFDRIWKFHQGLCEVYSPRDHFLRFVKRSCNMPPRYCLHGVKKQNILHSNSKPIAIAHQGVSSSGISEISGVHRNLFDKGGPADASVEVIFYKEVYPLIHEIFHGSNATVFAYGATASGKTYTMQGTAENPGLMPLAMSTVLSMCQRFRGKVEISCYEVYMERCFDLLEAKEGEISVLDDHEGQIHLRGLSSVPVNSISEFDEAFSRAIERRKVGHTGLNDVSSRSHGVLVIRVSTPCGDGSGAVVTGKLNLIDLAGNEDNRRTCNEGLRLQESAKINQSLFALSNVIHALNNNEPRVPYRESKLTRILQDSLGGKSRSLMVACLNPGEYYEAVHTVGLAARSRHISNLVPSAQKKYDRCERVDMEAKLQFWLNSRGKPKTAERSRACGSQSLNRTPSSVISSVKKQNILHSNSKPIAIAHQGVSSSGISEISGVHRNLFDKGGPADASVEARGHAAKGDAGEGIKPSASAIPLACGDFFSGDQEKFLALGPLREVLSPIDANVSRRKVAYFESVNPQTPDASTCEWNETKCIGTPLDKFNARSSNLKNTLAQEYVDFLNAASLEELLEIKGIGSKTAECIIELREKSPLKSLSDLEKLGLSSKQVHNLFSTAAKGIFT